MSGITYILLHYASGCECRLNWLLNEWSAYQPTGVLLVGQSGTSVGPVPVGEDVGLFVLVPLLARLLGTDPLSALVVFVLGAALISYLASSFFMCLLLRDENSYKIPCIVLLLFYGLVLLNVGDSYALSVFVVPPLALFCCLLQRTYFTSYSSTDMYMHVYILAYTAVFVFGLVASAANTIRGFSALGLGLACLGVILFGRIAGPVFRLMLVIVLAVGILVPRLTINYLVHERDAYIASQRSDYKPILAQHPLWHNIYIGMGFLANPLGVEYLDRSGVDAISRVDSSFVTDPEEEWQFDWAKYEQIMPSVVFSFVLHHLVFVIKTYLAKLGSMLIYLPFGLPLLLYGRIALRELSLFPILLATALPSLVSVPYFKYSAPFCAALLVFSFVVSYEAHMWEHLRKWVKNHWNPPPLKRTGGYVVDGLWFETLPEAEAWAQQHGLRIGVPK